MTSPIVEHLSPESTKKDKWEYKGEHEKVSLKNLINNAVWEMNDLVFTTPAVMSFLIDELNKYDPYDINPAVIAIDEFDLLFSNPGVADHMHSIVWKFAGKNEPHFGPVNSKR